MKKLTLVSALFILAAGALFAQLANGIYVNAWGRGAFVPLWYETAEWQYGEEVPNSDPLYKNGTSVTWDPGPNSPPRVDFRINGATDYVGFTVHVNSEFNTSFVGNGDNGAQLWVKPFGNNILKLTVANQFIDDTLRGKVTTDTGFENFILGATMMELPEDGSEPLNQDVIFNRFAGGRGGHSVANASNTSTPLYGPLILSNVFFLSSVPIDGLFFGLMLQGQYPDTDARTTWRIMQIGAGYEIPKIGHFRAQYIGGFTGKETGDEEVPFNFNAPAKVEAAFALTAISDLVIDLGFKIWMPLTDIKDVKSYKGLDVAWGASYRHENGFNIAAIMQALSLGAYTGTRVHDEINSKGADGARLVLNLIPAYDFDFGTVGLSFILQTKLADTGVDDKGENTRERDDKSAWTQFGVGGWYKKAFAGGYIKTGIAYAFPFIEKGPPPSYVNANGDTVRKEDQTGFNGKGILTIPIILEYAFF